MESFGEFVLITFVICVIFVIMPSIMFSKGAQEGNKLIEACEEKLPRDQYCVLQAVPYVKETP